jgi:hypothetical protein
MLRVGGAAAIAEEQQFAPASNRCGSDLHEIAEGASECGLAAVYDLAMLIELGCKIGRNVHCLTSKCLCSSRCSTLRRAPVKKFDADDDRPVGEQALAEVRAKEASGSELSIVSDWRLDSTFQVQSCWIGNLLAPELGKLLEREFMEILLFEPLALGCADLAGPPVLDRALK